MTYTRSGASMSTLTNFFQAKCCVGNLLYVHGVSRGKYHTFDLIIAFKATQRNNINCNLDVLAIHIRSHVKDTLRRVYVFAIYSTRKATVIRLAWDVNTYLIVPSTHSLVGMQHCNVYVYFRVLF